MKLQKMTREFRDAFDVKPDPSRDLDLIVEEYIEWQESDSGCNELKELADLVYVIFQYAASMNYDLEEALRRVHASNMSKIGPDGKIMRNEKGKVLKGPNYQPPNLEGCY